MDEQKLLLPANPFKVKIQLETKEWQTVEPGYAKAEEASEWAQSFYQTIYDRTQDMAMVEAQVPFQAGPEVDPAFRGDVYVNRGDRLEARRPIPIQTSLGIVNFYPWVEDVSMGPAYFQQRFDTLHTFDPSMTLAKIFTRMEGSETMRWNAMQPFSYQVVVPNDTDELVYTTASLAIQAYDFLHTGPMDPDSWQARVDELPSLGLEPNVRNDPIRFDILEAARDDADPAEEQDE